MKFITASLAILAVLCGSSYAAPVENAAASGAIAHSEAASLDGKAAEWKPRRGDDEGRGHHGGNNDGPKLTKVRICWDGKFQYAMLDLSDPTILKIDAKDIYAPNWNTMALKSFLKHQIQIPESGSSHHANVNSQPVPWWRPLYLASSCMLQERLEADFAFEYKQIPEKKTTAEPVYYRQTPNFPAIITAGVIGQFVQEMALRTNEINNMITQNANGNINHGHQMWMVPAFRLRNKQLGEAMAKGPDA
ncbi:hypothetical protein HGRIS_011349 [Hohenbuehelia grisea]|uniref:Uncharacterized protein n=1 Tax=Hohenbuehelia grisea TaxID=104357 RepID=A0ABR3JVS2_9AGAR